MPNTTLGSSIPGSALHIPTYPNLFVVGVLFPPSFVPVVFVPKEGCLDTSVAVIFEFAYFVHGHLELLFVVVFYVLKWRICFFFIFWTGRDFKICENKVVASFVYGHFRVFNVLKWRKSAFYNAF